MLRAIYILDNFDLIYGEAHKEINERVDVYAPPQTKETIKNNPELLAEAEIIFSGWGCPKMDADFLQLAPKLQAVFYGAGSIKGIVTDAFWDRNIAITSAYEANAIPVVEFTVSQILFSLKRGWYFASQVKKMKSFSIGEKVPGGYGATVGLISLGMIGRKVANFLKQFDCHVIAYDPFVSKQEAEELQVEMCELDDVFRRADVVSIHTPWIKETEGLITGNHLAAMKKNATLINTSRGAIIREQEMIAVLQERPDLYALLDVTYPEPPEPNSPLYILENVILTPHIAGSQASECLRMGAYMAEELKRYLDGEPLKWGISKEKVKIMA
ncbi:hydroxyacid dehydrogenase [Caldibacillus lycopersici]|uniref:Hydroxyacid dehydrogenase n=1 Tax=Perspicuibacillus lycopersici TaxID=1325689 RepID=A0AAE3IWT8_9BACI|nr:hydroxyacid dehydrogenase [Perspicuibacillus lycopersici]MCU9614841.1 hydroxyacid dehydrogenase [Perspicuibacillus lycopersici]